MSRFGLNEGKKRTYVVAASQTILGGANVWENDAGLLVDDAAAGESAIPVGMALHDAEGGEVVTVMIDGVGTGLATDAEEFPIGSPLKVNTSDGKWELGVIDTDLIWGIARSATTGEDGEYFEVERFATPYPVTA